MTDLPRPPAHVEPIVRVLGAPLAVRFLMRFGGAELYLAADPKGRSAVAGLLTTEQAAALAALHLPRRVPTAKPWLAQYLHSVEGLSGAEIARRLHVTDVAVRGYLRGGPKRPAPGHRQLSLF